MQKSLTGLSAVVLAAGGSSRLGRPKQLLRLGSRPLIVRSASLARRLVGGRVIVVIGAERQRLRSVLRRHDPSLDVVSNPRWPDGLAGSLGIGLAHVPSGSAGALVLLVDQARLGPADVQRLVGRWRMRPDRPAAAFYQGHSGAPVVLPARLFGAARALSGDSGARQLLRDLDRVTLVDMPAAAFDIDMPDDVVELALVGRR